MSLNTANWKDSIRLENLFQKVYSFAEKINAEMVLRPSKSIPFCALYNLMDTQYDNSFEKDFYTSIGNAINENLQKHFMRTLEKECYGDFCCKKFLYSKEKNEIKTVKTCNKRWSFTTPFNIFKNHKCKNCDKPELVYQEIPVDIENHHQSHIDMLIKVNKKFVLIDFKSTSGYIFTEHAKRNNSFPYRKYMHQIRTYTYLVEKQYKIKIDKVCILYVLREKSPKKSNYTHKWFVIKVDKKLRKESKKILLESIENYNQAKSFIDEPTNKKLNSIYENRYCQNKELHDSTMGPTFLKSVCPYWENKSCPSGKIKGMIKEKYKQQ